MEIFIICKNYTRTKILLEYKNFVQNKDLFMFNTVFQNYETFKWIHARLYGFDNTVVRQNLNANLFFVSAFLSIAWSNEQRQMKFRRNICHKIIDRILYCSVALGIICVNFTILNFFLKGYF